MQTSQTRAVEGGRTGSRAFTLIELLVVIAIIALLIAILLPALGQAKKLAAMLKEQVNASQQATAWAVYATDNKDAAFTGYIPWEVGHLNNNITPRVWLMPDPLISNYFLEGNIIKIAGARWMGAAGLTDEVQQLDGPTRKVFQTRSKNPSSTNPTWSPPTSLYDTAPDTYMAAMAYHPSMGFNYSLVGGNAHRGAMRAFVRANPGQVGNVKKFFDTLTNEVQYPSRNILAATSRGVDISTTGGWGGTSYGTQAATWNAGSSVVPGFWEIVPPQPLPSVTPSSGPTSSTPQGAAITWVNTPEFVKESDPKSYGFVDFRHFKKAVTSFVDGHVEALPIRKMRDMRLWSWRAQTSTSAIQAGN